MVETPGEQIPSKKAAYIVALMFICYGFSYLDRNVLTILTQSIKHSLLLTDTQIGVLGGFAFSIFFFLGGLPLSWLIDRTNRVYLIAVCVLIWSCATVTSGLSTAFPQLLLSRAATAAAEAALIPAGLSIFADVLPLRRIPLASSILMLGAFVGGGAALYLGGLALTEFSVSGVEHWFLPEFQPWQRVYVAIGLSGLVPIALLFFSVREPVRRELADSKAKNVAPAPSIRRVFSYLFVESRFYAPYLLGICSIFLVFYAVNAWFPAFLIREFNLPAEATGKSLGPAFIVCGIVGTLASQLFLRQVTPQNIIPRVVTLVGCLCVLQAATMAAVPFARGPVAAILLYCVVVGVTGAVVSIMYIPLQLTVPNRMRGQTIGIAYCGVNLLGTGLGPFLIGFINDRFFASASSLGISMSIVGIVASVLAASLFVRTLFVFIRDGILDCSIDDAPLRARVQ
jgi:MFS family permease